MPAMRFYDHGRLTHTDLDRLTTAHRDHYSPAKPPNRHDNRRWLRSIAHTLSVAADVLEQSDGEDRGLALRVLCQVLILHEALWLVDGALATIEFEFDFSRKPEAAANIRAYRTADELLRDFGSALNDASNVMAMHRDIVHRAFRAGTEPCWRNGIRRVLGTPGGAR